MIFRDPSTSTPPRRSAERVLLPGDPGRALMQSPSSMLRGAEDVQPQPRALGLAPGKAADGEPLTIQATGMGGPSAAIVLTELIALGARSGQSASAPAARSQRALPSATW